ncbi:MAG: phosphodiesterase [Bacilli bacterium]
MKYLIFSDLHGDYLSCQRIINEFETNKCDKFIFLGDLLYHGPRNDLPSGYDTKKVVELLKPYKDKFIWIKGNCDAEVDEMVTSMTNESKISMNINGFDFIFTHGHHLSSSNPDLNIKKGTIVVYGHYHRFEKININEVCYLNIGSCSIPRDGKKQYGILTEDKITIYSFDNDVLISESISFELDVNIPNKVTAKAIEDSKKIAYEKENRFDDIDSLKEALDK